MCNENNMCSICLNSMDSDRIITLKCNHSFHISCGFKWLNINKSCPLCRDTVDMKWVMDNNGLKNENKKKIYNGVHIIRIIRYRRKNNSINLSNEEISLIINREEQEWLEEFNRESSVMDYVNHIGSIGYSFLNTLMRNGN